MLWMTIWAMILVWPIWWSSVPIWLCLLIDLGILVWLALALRKNRWANRRTLSYREGGWLLNTENQELRLSLSREFYSNPWLTVLVFRTDEHRRLTQVILPDSADKDELRCLRVFLKNIPQTDVTA
jgi:hypothetical protein